MMNALFVTVSLLLSVLILGHLVRLNHLVRKGVRKFMATFQEVKDKLVSVAAGVDGLEDQIKALRAEVAAGKVITQEQLDELAAAAAAIGDDIADTSDQ